MLVSVESTSGGGAVRDAEGDALDEWAVRLDDEFVRTAARSEPDGASRIARARRISAQHRTAQPWRTATPGPSGWDSGRRSARRRDVRAFLAVACAATLVLGGLKLASEESPRPTSFGPVSSRVTGDAPPVPPDAAQQALGRPAAAPAGEGGYAFIDVTAGEPVRWDPCRPIHYVIRTEGAPPDADATVAKAVATLSAATGLVFVHDGPTDEAPSKRRRTIQRDRYGDGWAPVLIAWSDPSESPMLADSVAGYAAPVSFGADGRGERYVSGTVVLDGPQLADDVPEAEWSVLLHELGHLAGLDHVDDPADTMAEYAALTQSYTAGAQRGLHLLGLGPCFS